MFQFLKSLFNTSRDDAVRRAVRALDENSAGLQEGFLRIAGRSGKPRGLRWTRCDWLTARSVVRDPVSGILTAFVSVNVSFEAIEGGDMEGIEAVSTIREGCATLHFQDGRWGTAGRVLFNVDPTTAAAGMGDGCELVHCVD